MAKLTIKTSLDSVVIVGEFCDWKVDQAIRLDRKPKARYIYIEDMYKGEYRVLASKDYINGEIYPTDGRQMSNRYFSGMEDEKIVCFFN